MEADSARPASRYVNWTSRFWGFALAASIGGALLVGAFGTHQLPLLTRIGLWVLLMTINAAKWYFWWRISSLARSRRTALFLAGAFILNLTTPLEVRWALAMSGSSLKAGYLDIYIPTVLCSLLITAAIVSVRQWAQNHRGVSAAPRDEFPKILKMAGVLDRSALLAMEAEDHYVGLRLEGGERPLVYYRFRDAVEELGPAAGAQISRSTWIAEGAVVSVHRSGRQWQVKLRDGSTWRVTERFVEGAKARGWL